MVTETPSCPAPLRLKALRLALRQFCKRTEAWRETLDPISVLDGVSDYSIAPSYNASVLRVIEAKLDGRVLGAEDYDVIDNEILRLTTEPEDDSDDGLEVTVALMPDIDITEVADAFLNQWRETIVAGAMADLLSMKEREWSNAGRAGDFQKDFIRGIGEAVREKNAQHKNVTLRLKARSWV
jgi:hypothetical protein